MTSRSLVAVSTLGSLGAILAAPSEPDFERDARLGHCDIAFGDGGQEASGLSSSPMRISALTDADADRLGLLPDRAFSPFHRLRDL